MQSFYHARNRSAIQVSEKKVRKRQKVVDMVSDTMLKYGHAEQESR